MTSMKSLLGDRVLIEPLKPEEVTPSGLLVPDIMSRELPTEGKVVGLPKSSSVMGLTDPNSFLNVGDNVLFNAYAGEDIVLGTVVYKMLFIEDIYCLVSPSPHALSV